MRHLKHLFTALLLLCSLTSTAHEFEVDGIYYNIQFEEDKTVEVTCRGSYYDEYSNEYSGSVVIPESVTYSGTTYSVTSIGDYAFCECTGLTSIEIPNSVTSIGCYAFSGCTGITSVTISNGVTSIGYEAFRGCTNLTSIEIPNSVLCIGGSAFWETAWYNNQPDGVVYAGKLLYSYKGSMPANTSIIVKDGTSGIADFAFYNCSGLTSIEIPNSVTSIGSEAFCCCANLTSIEIPNSVTSIGHGAFYYCTGLTSVVIPNSVKSIGYSAFSGCSGLTSIEIPNSVTSIGSDAFSCCANLTSIEIPNSVTRIGGGAFWETAWYNNQPDGVVYAGKLLYSYKGSMPANTSITVKDGTLGIADFAFHYCTGFTSIEIPNSVTRIGDSAFSGCRDLTSIIIPNSVTEIGSEAFYGCTGITSVTIGNGVTSIESHTFYNCSGLEKVYISDLSAWCNIDFASSTANPLYYAKNLYLNGELITELVIPNSVTSIGGYAFIFCSSLTSIVIPNSVTSIGSEAFYKCKGLTSIEIPNSVTRIGGGAFEDCTSLTSVEIPNSVTSIGYRAFFGCSGLTSVTIGSGMRNIYSEAFAKCDNLADVYCLATSVPSTNATAFNDSYHEDITLHVPAEAINSYRTTAPWSSFGTIVTLNGEDIEPEIPEVKICATPVISYSDGKLLFECETEGAECVTDIKSNDIDRFYGNSVNLSATYSISVYAMATGYENSETVNATLCWIECECEGNDYTNVMNIPATAALVTSNGGVLSISCSLDGEEIAVYTTDGVFIATTTIEHGAATVATGLSKGTVAIVKIGNKSIKVAVN